MKTVRLRYFAACNSEEGFYSFYRNVFTDELTNIYIIKGGPGTGKSSLMCRVADAAEQKGYRIEEIYCSSDPESLDGVIAQGKDRSFAVLDGTAPHVTEMELPGARDEILYIGDFWSADRLREQKTAIAGDDQKRAECYRTLYRFLKAAGQCERNMEEAMSPLLDRDKLSGAISRILLPYPMGSAFSQKTMLISSIGMYGYHQFPTFEEHADTVYDVYDCGEIAYLLYDELIRMAEQRGLRVWVSYDPLIPSRKNGVCLPDCRLSFVRCTENFTKNEKTVHRFFMRRYIDTIGYHAVCKSIETAQKCRDRLMDAAIDTLKQIRNLHFSVEARYVAAMDFESMRQHTDTWIEKIITE